ASRRRRTHTIVHDEASAAVKDNSGRIPLIAVVAWNDKLRDDRAGADIEQCGCARSVISNPPRCGWTRHETPGVDDVGIRVVSRHESIREQIVLKIKLRLVCRFRLCGYEYGDY